MLAGMGIRIISKVQVLLTHLAACLEVGQSFNPTAMSPVLDEETPCMRKREVAVTRSRDSTGTFTMQKSCRDREIDRGRGRGRDRDGDRKGMIDTIRFTIEEYILMIKQ